MSAGGKTFAVLVGNNKNLWSAFLQAYNSDESLKQSEDPLDTYVERSIKAATSSFKCAALGFAWGTCHFALLPCMHDSMEEAPSLLILTSSSKCMKTLAL
jgi:hypothetical protein